mmetsp:Transcript_13491/g.18494  ORF Transcript_13491/g.18494 Transcript_13491/m.18494 type:complete len:231 (+) Transcript_13491:416-1108(+)
MAVTSWRSKSVRPHEGQDTYSVLVLRMREPCSMPKEVVLVKDSGCTSGWPSMSTPSPSPSTSRAPAQEPPPITNASVSSEAEKTRWWITGMLMSWRARVLKTLREACTRFCCGVSSRSITASDSFNVRSSSSDSAPVAERAKRWHPSGRDTLDPWAAKSLRATTATAPARGLACRAARGASKPTFTSRSLLRHRRAAASSVGGNSRSRIESEVAMSLKGIPTISLHPRSL